MNNMIFIIIIYNKIWLTLHGWDCGGYSFSTSTFARHLFFDSRDRTRQSQVRAFSYDLPRRGDRIVIDDITSLVGKNSYPLLRCTVQRSMWIVGFFMIRFNIYLKVIQQSTCCVVRCCVAKEHNSLGSALHICCFYLKCLCTVTHKKKSF
jgi:hypothetical protein